MLATLVGLSMLLALVGGTATLARLPAGRRLRARQARRHPQQAAARERTRQARRLAAEWPLLAQTLGLGYRDQWTRQHRFPTAEFVADDQGVTATVAAIAGASLADYQRAAGYLADTWGCVSVRAEQQGPGLIRLRGLHRDPLLLPARVDLSGMAPESLDVLVAGLGRGQHPGHHPAGRGLRHRGRRAGRVRQDHARRPPPRPARPLPGGAVRARRRQGRPRLRPALPAGLAVGQGRPDRGARRAPAGASADGRPPGHHRPGARA